MHIEIKDQDIESVNNINQQNNKQIISNNEIKNLRNIENKENNNLNNHINNQLIQKYVTRNKKNSSNCRLVNGWLPSLSMGSPIS